MSIQSFIERRWYSSSPGILWLLFPFELLFLCIAGLRKSRYQKQITVAPESTKPIPVIVVGNIGVGGTGKTPTIIALVKYFQSLKLDVAVVSRGYGRTTTGLMELNSKSIAAEVGDEPLEIYRATDCAVVVDTDRAAAVNYLKVKVTPDIILSDDGLQHYLMPRDIELVVVSSQRQFGNGHCLPVGPLREPITRLNSVDYVLYNGGVPSDAPIRNAEDISNIGFSVLPKRWVNVHSGEQIPLADLHYDEGRLVAITGLGEPQKFFRTLDSLGLNCKTIAKPDHYFFTEKDFFEYERSCVLMTAKDAVKCVNIAPKNSWYLQIEAQFEQSFLNLLHSKIKPH